MTTEAQGVAQSGDLVRVHYTGSLDDGTVFDTSRQEGDPIAFVVGEGQLIPGFESAVVGMAVGESRTVRLEPDEAFGQRDERLMATVSREGAPDDLEVGDIVVIDREGHRATVVQLTDDELTLDLNHSLAGKALNFDIELVGIG